MRLTLTRTHYGQTCTLGALSNEAGWMMHTLERLPTAPKWPCIPAGVYPLTVELCFNSRLWTPYKDRELPRLHGVPGRIGVLMHAGNAARDTEGCVIVGFDLLADGVGRSRDALTRLVDLLRAERAPSSIAVGAPPGVDLGPVEKVA